MTAYLQACDCHTGLGGAAATLRGLLDGEVALELQSVSAEPGGERVPLALRQPTAKVTAPRWWADLLDLLANIPESGWGRARRPVIVSSSNFGIDHLYQIGTGLGPGKAARSWATAHGIAAQLQQQFGWGDALHLVSHACVSAQVALCMAKRMRWFTGPLTRKTWLWKNTLVVYRTRRGRPFFRPRLTPVRCNRL